MPPVRRCDQGTSTGVSGTSPNGTGVEAVSTNGTGLTTTDADQAALAASAIDGMAIDATTDTGWMLRGSSGTGGGINVASPVVHLRPANLESRGVPTSDTTAHQRGYIVETSGGEPWVCVANGTPGTWRKLAGPSTAGAFHALTAPVRVYDSRPGLAPTGVGPKAPSSRTPCAPSTSRPTARAPPPAPPQ